MLQTTNFNQANVCALYNKGVNVCAVALDSLTSKNEKKTANYLVVPNNCILSLSLSLSSRAGVNYTFFSSRLRAREACRNPCKQRTSRSFLCSFFVSLPKPKYREIKNEITTIFNQ